MEKQWMVITTAYRGVFYGLAEPSDAVTMRIEHCRMTLYWPAEVKGVLGLASYGPREGCRITDAVPQATLHGVTAWFAVDADAVKRWEAYTW